MEHLLAVQIPCNAGIKKYSIQFLNSEAVKVKKNNDIYSIVYGPKRYLSSVRSQSEFWEAVRQQL